MVGGAHGGWCVQRTLLWSIVFPCCKSFGVLRTPSRRGRVRCTHQHRDKSNRITWRFFHRRYFLGVNPLMSCAHRHDEVGYVVRTNTATNRIASPGHPSTHDSSIPHHCPYLGALGVPYNPRAGSFSATLPRAEKACRMRDEKPGESKTDQAASVCRGLYLKGNPQNFFDHSDIRQGM